MPSNPSSLRRAVAFAAVACLFAAPLGAQTASAPATPPATPPVATPPAPGLITVAEVMYEHDFSAGVKDTANADLSEDRFGIGAKSTQDWDQNHLVLNAGYSFDHYDFTGVQAPFSSINDLGASVYYGRDITSQWGAFGYFGANEAADSSASFFSAGQWALAAGPTYKEGQDLTLSIGPMIYNRLEDSTTWTVFGQADWNFLPQWELHAYAGYSNGVTVAYDIFNNHQTIADATVEYNSNWFEISPVAGLDRSVDETNVILRLGVRQVFSGHYFVRGYVSLLLDREYQFHVNGNSANSADIENTLGLGFEAGMAF